MLALMAGFQVRIVFPATLGALAEPGVGTSAGMMYGASAAGMVSAGVPVPVAKPLAETVAVQLAPKPRSSVTWTMPSPPLRVPPGAGGPRRAGAARRRRDHGVGQDSVAGIGVVHGGRVGDGSDAAGGQVPGPGEH